MPKIENFCGGVRVIIERTNFIKLSAAGQTTTETIIQKTSQETSQETPQETSQKTSQKTPQKIIELIRNNPYISTQEMADIIGIDRRNITRNLRGLYDRGVLRRVGPDKGGHWEIIEK